MTDDILHRELCPDGACIGVIGDDGLCKECGRASPTLTQDPRNRGMVAVDDDDTDGFEDERQLCRDEACIGVIGADGLCTECGEPAPEGATTDDEPGDGDGEAAPVRGRDDDGDELDEFEARELCPDGACIGLIGADGRCRECGRSRSES